MGQSAELFHLNNAGKPQQESSEALMKPHVDCQHFNEQHIGLLGLIIITLHFYCSLDAKQSYRYVFFPLINLS
jgi:hypothetical protein